MLHMVSEHGFGTMLEQDQQKTVIINNKLTHVYFLKFSYTHRREVQLYFAGNMTNAGVSLEEEHHQDQPLNNEEGNLWDGKFQVDLNEIQENKSKLKRIVDELRYELRKGRKIMSKFWRLKKN